ncbi:Uncharacterized membrane protein [Micromonospora citrea]|uniref:Uncharacterized membrane protein n=1 Tax=Micromonospora citrea TaxID=47855 RepID=A0A1C6TUG0_9ACTN|nr:DUF2254 domain-containing protein [Micromonospora citrea]SCL45251.1 Uncharacterized membrane protein [Micromonospora citrea]
MARRQTRSTRTAAIRDSFWLMPACFAACSLLLAIALSTVELRLVLPLNNVLPSGPAGARALLSAIITAMISLTALVFSITVVALQLVASQYSPRILRTFLEDRVIQAALGLFIATFLFAMVVLAALPDRPGPRVPELSLATSLLLVLASSAVFVWYLHHVTTIMRVSHVVAAIGAQTRRSVDTHHRVGPGTNPAVPSGPPFQIVAADSSGMITDIDVDRLARTAGRHHCLVVVLPAPGDFVVAGQPLLATYPVTDTPPRPLPPGVAAAAVTIGPERSPGRDVGFGFRQLADIAERALSPGVNDLTTAVRAIQESHDLLRRLATRPDQPEAVFDAQGRLRAVAPRQSFASFLAVAIDDVAHAGRDQPRIVDLLRRVLDDLAVAAADYHRPAISRRRRLLDTNPTPGGTKPPTEP